MKRLVSVRELSQKLGVPRAQLEAVAADVAAHYHDWERTDPRTGKQRMIRIPSKEIKGIQSRIAKRLFSGVTYGHEVQGGIRGRSPKTNAELHLARPCVVAVDVRKFFPSVRPKVVYQMLRVEFGFGRDVAALITRLVTLGAELPQGAPTSGVIANLLMRLPVDAPVRDESRANGCGFSRFVDDLALSGENPREFINLIARSLSKRGLAISRKEKLKIMPQTGRQEITGLLVNGNKPSLSQRRRDRVRSAIHKLRTIPAGEARDRAVRSVKGRIAHVRQYNPGSARRLENDMLSIKW